MLCRSLCVLLTLLIGSSAAAADGAKVVSYYGYEDCIQLTNDQVTAVLCPAAGGRVLEYSLGGKNMLYLPPGDEGWRYQDGSSRGPMNAGRFDIGPEKIRKRGDVLWMGSWTGKITGDRSARLTSQFDPISGVRLIRDFQLDPESSRLSCTQTIVNESDREVSLCHWSRTFAVGGGVAVVPRSKRERFPRGYLMYGPNNAVMIQPDDPNIQVTDDAIVVAGPPQYPKLGFDSLDGWMAYLAPHDQLFVKRFRTYPDRAYNEFAGLTISVWYPEQDRVELEPIGPAENLAPGQRASFTEHWWLLPHKFATGKDGIDFAQIQSKVMEQTLVVPTRQGRNVTSPEVHNDGRVTFRFVGPDATSVGVRLAGQTQPMRQGIDGVWTTTTEPLDPGIYEYTFDVGGIRVTDPNNRWVKKWLVCASLFEVPGDPPPLTQQQTVPQGSVHRHAYFSDVTSGMRAAMVYTPPGYDAQRDQPYPVVVLCHGNGDDETAWTEVGRMHHIVDNLIAAKSIDPMVIVMPYGHPVPLANRRWSENYGERNSDAMIKDMVEVLLPLIQQRYNVTDDATERAVVGLSMGGGHSIMAGMTYPNQFAWVGAFSAATPQGDLADEHPELLRNVQADNQARKLFWIACGKSDFLIDRNRQFTEQLTRHDIRHTYLETEGAHTWDVWRDYLPRFLKTLFK